MIYGKVHRAGFTLLEMVIVLTIIAAVTLVATREVSRVQDQRRYEVSQRGVEAIRAAILGEPVSRAPAGTLPETGFLADMGRYPTALAELWEKGENAEFALRAAPEDSEVRIASGWNGPYLRLPVGSGVLKDGWGREFVFAASGGGVEFGHYGADGLENIAEAEGYDRDIILRMPAEDARATVWGRVVFEEDGANASNGMWAAQSAWTIRAYGPDPDDSGGVLAAGVAVAATNAMARSVGWEISGLTPGPRALRAYRVGATNDASDLVYVHLRKGLNGPVLIKAY